MTHHDLFVVRIGVVPGSQDHHLRRPPVHRVEVHRSRTRVEVRARRRVHGDPHCPGRLRVQHHLVARCAALAHRHGRRGQRYASLVVIDHAYANAVDGDVCVVPARRGVGHEHPLMFRVVVVSGPHRDGLFRLPIRRIEGERSRTRTDLACGRRVHGDLHLFDRTRRQGDPVGPTAPLVHRQLGSRQPDPRRVVVPDGYRHVPHAHGVVAASHHGVGDHRLSVGCVVIIEGRHRDRLALPPVRHREVKLRRAHVHAVTGPHFGRQCDCPTGFGDQHHRVG